MRLGIFLACTIHGIVFLVRALESDETLFQFLEASHSIDRSTSLSQINSMNFYSQASQDKFVYIILYGLLGKQDEGSYLEIGAGEPIFINNSYFFEKNLKWSGVSIDISEALSEQWYSLRTNPLLIEDATKTDYGTILQSFPKVIDYLSLDVDVYYTDVLKKIPFRDHIFKVITIEHDFYRYGDLYRNEERRILESFGYYLLCSDVSNNGKSFEDWWVHPSCFVSSDFSAIKSLDLNAKDHAQIIQTLNSALRVAFTNNLFYLNFCTEQENNLMKTTR